MKSFFAALAAWREPKSESDKSDFAQRRKVRQVKNARKQQDE
jgi:hypothetical protein